MDTRSSTHRWQTQVASLSDEALLLETLSCARSERELLAMLVAHLAEVYRRDLALKRGYPSLFKYAREGLGLTDSMAWERVAAARLALRVPETVDRLATGELTLAAAGELWKCLREEKKAAQVPIQKAEAQMQPMLISDAGRAASNVHPPAPPTPAETREVFARVLGKTRQESQAVLQDWRRERDGHRAEEGSEEVRPLARRKVHSREWTELAFFLGAEELISFDRLRDLLSHRLGTRDPHAVLSWLLENGLDRMDPARKEERLHQKARKKDEAPRRREQETERRDGIPKGRRKSIPAAMKRQVWLRDGGQCQHTDPLTGRRCESTAYLDLDHVVPVSKGGENEESNLRLSCANHNRRRFHWDQKDQPVSG